MYEVFKQVSKQKTDQKAVLKDLQKYDMFCRHETSGDYFFSDF